MKTNIEIAREARRTTIRPIEEIAARLGIEPESLELHGKHKAKVSLEALAPRPGQPEGKLILVTAMSPTPAGEGKTTTTVGLGDALSRLGKRAAICLRQPSMGPVFGSKGGAAGGGYSQVIPMEDINLHFTGDFHAVQVANNLLAALIDNQLHHGHPLGCAQELDPRRITWKRALDVSDRSLRELVIGLGGVANGVPRQDGFEISAASEIMAILCLARSREDLGARLREIVAGYSRAGRPVRVGELGVDGALAVLLNDALKPNLVQTIEGTPAFVHGGPFANIAHGCSSVVATRGALGLAEYVLTEAGFGTDLGAEKFLDIKCRQSGLWPAGAVIVATLRAIRHHGKEEGVTDADPVAEGVRGFVNLERHIRNLRENFGLPCVVALNAFASDSPADHELLRGHVEALGVPLVVCRHWAEGGQGAVELARRVMEFPAPGPARRYLYEASASLWEKMKLIAERVYGAGEVTTTQKVRSQLEGLETHGYGRLPVCVAKTQFSFSTDPAKRGAPVGHSVHVREVKLSAGAGFVVFVCGEMMTMPGLPKAPAAASIRINERGEIEGLF
jgi:formate--tetrahydrofolate ligase